MARQTTHVYGGPIRIVADDVLSDIESVLIKPVSTRSWLLGSSSLKAALPPFYLTWTTSWLGSRYAADLNLGRALARDPGHRTDADAALRADQQKCSGRSGAHSTTAT